MYCFGENIFVIEETFCALFLKMFCAFKKTFDVFLKKDFLFYRITFVVNFETLFALIRTDFMYLRKQWDHFLKKDFVDFLETQFENYRKDFEFQQTFCVFWATFFAPTGHRCLQNF